MSPSLHARLAAALAPGIRLDPPGDEGATVFTGQEASGRAVVVTALPELDGSHAAAERFRREIGPAIGVTHAHLVPLLAVGDAGGVPYVVGRAPEGETLRSRLARGRVPASEAVPILRAVAKGLAAAHARGLVHRGLDPDHVVLAPAGAVVVGAGLARARRAALAAAAGGTRAGGEALEATATTLDAGYRAPEQIAGDLQMDHRVDIYAWGMLAYEMLVGEHPFAGRVGAELAAAHRTVLPMPLHERVASVPRALGHLVDRAIAKSPAARPTSATELVSLLEHIRLDRREPEAPARVAVPAVVWRRIGGIAAVVGALAAGFAFLRRDAAVTREPAVIAVAPFRTAGLGPDAQYLREGLMDVMAAAVWEVGENRAADERALMAAVRREAPFGEADVDALLRAAARVGAMQLLEGGVTGTRDRVTVRATLHDVRDGAELATTSVDGSPDSLPALAARVAGELLPVDPDDLAEQLARVFGTNAEAIRSHLTGVAADRAGRGAEALLQFDDAVTRDSTFAAAWYRGGLSATAADDTESRLSAAWRWRERLARGDRLSLAARLGPRHPEPMSPFEALAAAEALADARPESPEAQVLYADRLYHAGQRGDVPDWLAQAIARRERALALDSTWQPAAEHLIAHHVAARDARAASIALARTSRADTAAAALSVDRMRVAALGNDAEAFARALAGALRLPARDRAIAAVQWQVSDLGRADATERLALAAAAAAGPAEREVVQQVLALTSLNAGQSYRLWEIVRVLEDSTVQRTATLLAAALAGLEVLPPAPAVQGILAATPLLLGGGDRRPAAEAGVLVPPDAPWALAAFAYARADTAVLTRLESTLATIDDRRVWASRRARALLAVVRLQRASLLRSAAVGELAARADSATRTAPDWAGFAASYGAWMVARGYAEAGRTVDARRVIARNVPGSGGWVHTASWRDAARYAEAAGATEDALRAWRVVQQLTARSGRAERAVYEESDRAIARLAAVQPTR